MISNKEFDVAIVGGGFYGSVLALHYKRKFKKVILIEKEKDILLKASYNNQARIHNGYHYPRSFITALRSHINYKRFIKDFKTAVVDDSTMIYAIATSSKVTSSQFIKLCKQIGAPISPASTKIKRLFNDRLIEDVFVVKEAVFNAAKLRKILKTKLLKAKTKILYKTEVKKIVSKDDKLILHLANREKIVSKKILNCAYSGINTLLKNSTLPTLSLKYELTEMPLLKMPKELKDMGITIMDGPFFSVMPFPDKKLHTLHHVRYTPQASKSKNSLKSNYIYMIKDAQRYMPSLEAAEYKGSLFETKTVLKANETNDARPILFRKNYGLDNLDIVMGGKIDNIYDVVLEMGL